ncbi:M48 family metallopeptidase [Microcoleus sp. FACHB-53]|nr:M48 family metallopeptidase [Microcoleus sp. FACHB-53]
MVKLKSPEKQQYNLPNYSIRESQRAKHLRLKVSIENGVEVIVPKGFDQSRIPGILQKKQVWLETAVKRIDERRQFFTSTVSNSLPESISLVAIAEDWKVEYHQTSASRVVITEKPGRQLLVRGKVNDVDACKLAFRRWISRKAHNHLVPWLKEVSQINNLPFEKTLIKGQKTRWASCSQHKTISLNYKLLFLPASLVHYVFIHELCHTAQLNHSRKFWALVNEKEPNYKQLNAELREAWRTVPLWVEPQSSLPKIPTCDCI